MTKKLKKRGKRIIAGAVIFLVTILADHTFPLLGQWVLLLYLLAYGVVGGDVVKKAASNISKGQIFDENFLMLIATVGAFLTGEYPEAVTVMLFYQVGEWFQSYAVNHSRKSIKELMNIRPDSATVLRQGEECEVEPDEVAIGEVIVVKPGERIPLDGIILKGNCSLDTVALTGESIPRDVTVGDEVISGCINLNSVIEVEVTREFANSTVSRILDLVENASSQKASTEQFISRFARYYTPIVVFLALALAVIPSILVGNSTVWIYRALSFLVISCPCALVISVPLSFFGGLGGASKAGILIKGSNYLEILAQSEIIVMDKTGTLTKGNFVVTEVVPVKEEVSKQQLLELAAYAECQSNHPIAKSLEAAYTGVVNKEEVGKVEEKAGLGVVTTWKGKRIYAGNRKLMTQLSLPIEEIEAPGTVCYIAVEESDEEKVIGHSDDIDGRKADYFGYIIIADEIKEDAKQCISSLKEAGIKRIIMLTGDRPITAQNVSRQVGIEEYHAGLLPIDKVELAEQFISEKSKNGKLVFVGDGINDAPVLARADIGIAMGGLGSDAAIEAADVVIMNDQPSKIATAMKISQKTLRIVKQNIVFAIGIKIIVLALAAIGVASMWMAVFADVGVAFIAILNAMRAMKIDTKS